jgi:puromycin-sensitive aminopeptidase
MSKNVTRLYKQFVPKNYQLAISISEDKKSFTGLVTITGRKVGRPSKRLTFHQKALKINKVSVTKESEKKQAETMNISRINSHKAYDELRIHSENLFYAGDYTVKIEYEGTITKNMDGVYPCFFELDGVKKELVATQFESHHAREAFPCIDEPEAKAIFSMSIEHDAAEIALGNTPVLKETTSGARKTTTFNPTPVMSTYLVAFVIGELGYKEATSKNGVKIRTYATPDQIKHTEFALDMAVKCMDFYEEYYDIPFPLGKCDFVALPDFASGAMENWGLITFREQALLYDEEHTSLSTKQWVALVVAHELTHQWFGNLVTMRWWTDLWLNEGFASWMEYLAIDTIFPDWDLWTQFTIDEQQSALKADALEHTHPIEVPVHHPDEIRTIFDAISYQKGASSIHMLQNYLGGDDFRNGLRHYLKKHSYQNTDTVDLWQALEDVTGKPVKDFMGAWTSQAGFPLLTIAPERDYLKILQQRFIANPTSQARNDKTLWPVPLLTNSSTTETVNKSVANVPYNATSFVKINEGQTGLYRVHYSTDLQEKQIDALKSGELSAVDRMGLLADSFEATKAGYQSTVEYLELLSHYGEEDALPVWEIIAGSLGSIRSILSSSDSDDRLREAMKPYILQLVEKQLKRLGWTNKSEESHLDKLLRPIIIGLAAAADHPKVLSHVEDAFADRLAEKRIDPDLRGIVFSTKARIGGEPEYESLLGLYKRSTSSDEKLSLTAGMTSFEQPVLHDKVLDLIKSDVVRTQDNGYWIAYSFMNRHGRARTWEWMKENWEWMRKTMGTDLSFSRMPMYAARNFAEQSLIDEYVNFFGSRLNPSIQRTYNQGLEVAQTNAAWRLRDAKTSLKWFSEHQK